MKIISSFKHLEHTPALDEKIKSKSQKLKKYFDGNLEVFWTCSARDGDHQAEVKILGPGFEYHASSQSETLYKSIDIAVSKIEKQVHKKKSMRRNHIHHKHDQTIKEQMIEERELDEHTWVQDRVS